MNEPTIHPADFMVQSIITAARKRSPKMAAAVATDLRKLFDRVQAAEAVCECLIAAYERANERNKSDWDDIDQAHFLALSWKRKAEGNQR